MADIIVKLPLSNEYDSILVVVDWLTKMTHLIPTNESITASGVAKLYLDNVFRLHGLPKEWTTDRGPQFASQVMREIHKSLGIKSSISTAYHPQTDGQTERMNQEIEAYIQHYVSHRQDNWSDLLSTAEFALNNWKQSAMDTSPFELNYGFSPKIEIAPKEVKTPGAENYLSTLKESQEDAKAALTLTAEQMKYFYNKHASKTPKYVVGEKAWLSTKNLKLKQPSRKLLAKWVGPYKVLELVGERAVRLALPWSWGIYNVFYVSLLKPHIPSERHQKPPELVEIEGEEEHKVSKIKDSRINCRTKKIEYLVEWKGYNREDSWEKEANVKNAKTLIKNFHKKNPSAPRHLYATIFDSLKFRPLENFTETRDGLAGWELGMFRRKSP
jgi:hypothetical protein